MRAQLLRPDRVGGWSAGLALVQPQTGRSSLAEELVEDPPIVHQQFDLGDAKRVVAGLAQAEHRYIGKAAESSDSWSQ